MTEQWISSHSSACTASLAFHLTQGKALALPTGLYNTLQDLSPQTLSSCLLVLASLLSLLQPHGAPPAGGWVRATQERPVGVSAFAAQRLLDACIAQPGVPDTLM